MAMNLKELTHDEQLALVTLSEMSLMADRELTDAEHAQLDEIVQELGEDNFRDLAEEAESKFENRDDLRTFLKTITRPEARELIYGTVLSEALLENMPHKEGEFLEWLGREWNVSVQLDAGDGSQA